MYFDILARALLIAILTANFSSVAIAQSSRAPSSEIRRIERMMALDATHFERTAHVQDSDLDVNATISTEEGFRYRGSFTDRVRSDNFLRAVITKRTGEATIQVYQSTVYNSPARHFRNANYQTPSGLKSAPLIIISETEMSCFGGSCAYQDDVGFEVPEADLRQIAAGYEAGDRRPWRFKLNATGGEDWEDSMSPAEIVGFLHRLDAYRANHR
ncbi:hypothetical protein [Allosphingosinicella sp.]|uniref:hypothetical protein n=1 Tax=Allosphingosinicella sp. TaxID=2823234 RepID=UPI0037846976